MRLHIVTVGTPKLTYAKVGWDEYVRRLKRYHQLRVTHISDKHNNATRLLEAADNSYLVTLEVGGREFSSPELAQFLETRALESREVCWMIGGPEGLPIAVTERADFHWSFGRLTFPHDLAMVILLESLYRASTISAGHPYHK